MLKGERIRVLSEGCFCFVLFFTDHQTNEIRKIRFFVNHTESEPKLLVTSDLGYLDSEKLIQQDMEF